MRNINGATPIDITKKVQSIMQALPLPRLLKLSLHDLQVLPTDVFMFQISKGQAETVRETMAPPMHSIPMPADLTALNKLLLHRTSSPSNRAGNLSEIDTLGLLHRMTQIFDPFDTGWARWKAR